MPQHDVNPYESPSSAPGDRPVPLVDAPARWRWLVRISLILAILNEIPEVDAQDMALQLHDMRLFLAVTAASWAVILVPLVLYIFVNGWRGITAAKGRITVIGIIVLLNLAKDTCFMVNWLTHK
jgi:hypothetical protein